jgi:hypothetical protein
LSFVSRLSAAPDKNRTRTRNRVERFVLSTRRRLGSVTPTESPQAFEAWLIYLQVKEEKAGGINEVIRRLVKGWSKVVLWRAENMKKEIEPSAAILWLLAVIQTEKKGNSQKIEYPVTIQPKNADEANAYLESIGVYDEMRSLSAAPDKDFTDNSINIDLKRF